MSNVEAPDRGFGQAKMCVLVMGAAAGTGLACARAFAADGHFLLVADNDGERLKRVASDLGAIALYCDVASEASVQAFADDVARSFRGLDVIVNAAGKRYVRTLGTMRVTRALKPMLERDGQRKDVVNIADLDPDPDAGPFPYAASTQAFVSLSHALAAEMRGTAMVLTTYLPARGEEEWDDELFLAPHHKVADANDDPAGLATTIITVIADARRQDRAATVSTGTVERFRRR